ncbi:MAG: Mrp/NBP35 family ATP-binding protein [Bacilli bacterium]|jgi:ATP-binding protein involved in chromosome partitioning|nr:Mrp/NBP35 family ATP-binding protein [Bacilli bacterium]
MEDLKKQIIEHKYQDKTIGQMFKEIKAEIKDDKVYLDLGFEDNNLTIDDIKKDLMKFLKLDLKYKGAKITFTDLIKEDLEKNSIIHKDNVLYLLIASGKGGVGKSNVAANLAVAFNDLNYKVALIDCDIYGSSIPNIFEVDKYPRISDGILYAYNKDGIDIASVDFLTRSTLPIIWRGPMLNQALNHFFYYTRYQNDIDVVIIDMPPGTGDVALDVFNAIPNAKQIIVTTPHQDAATIAIKAGIMALQMKFDILGVIENMSYYEYEDKKLDIFGFGGGDMVANALNVPLLEKLPIAAPKNGGLYQKDEKPYQIYQELAKKIKSYTE